jgi:hypothetical protein
VSILRYKRKTRPAIWTQTFPEQRRKTLDSTARVAQAAKSHGHNTGNTVAANRSAARSATTPRKHVRPVSAKRRTELRQYAPLARAFVAAHVALGEACPVVSAIPELRDGRRYGWPISSRLTEVHHRRGRAGSLLLDMRHWLAVSRIGHRWIHSHPTEARARGWLCEVGYFGRKEL